MQQAIESVAVKARTPRSFKPWETEIAVVAHQGSGLIDDACIWIDHAETMLQMMASELERGEDADLLSDWQRLQAGLHAAMGAIRMARGMVNAMPVPAGAK